jgi:hypothetical protein
MMKHNEIMWVSAMEISEACALSEDEEVVLTEGNYVGRDEAVVLTNMRLVFLKSKGRFHHKTYEKEDEIPFQDIESAHYDREFDAVVLELKNGEKEMIMFYKDMLGSFLEDDKTSEIRLQATIDRWISAINDRANRGPKRSRCAYCGQVYDEGVVNCPRCGASR